MIGIPLLLSTLLLAAGSGSVACVLYANQGTLRYRLNKLLLAIGCCLLLWGFGLGLRVSAAALPAALAGSHIAPVGYAMLFGFLLHYVLLLTGHAEFLRRRWPCLLIYLPGALTAFGLAILPFFGRFPYSLARTPLGWVNNTWNFWVLFYYVYYLCFLIAVVLLLWRWARGAASPKTRRQGALLLASIVAMSVCGTLTDVLPGVFRIQTPGLAECFAILPILAICRSVKRLDFMRPEKPSPNEIIINKESLEKRIYAIFGAILLLGGALSLIGQAALPGKAGPAGGLALGGLLLASGFIMLSLNRITGDEAVRELLLAMIFSVFIPLITLLSAPYGGITIWAFLFLLIVPSLLFNRGILLITVLLSAFQTQLVLLAATPRAEVRIGAFDYAVRLGLIVAAAGLSFFVSLVYRRRMRENAEHAVQQKAASDLSRTLLPADVDNWEETFSAALGVCSAFFRCERACFALLHGEAGRIGRICAWPGGDASSEKEEGKIRYFLSKLQARLGENEILTLSEETAEEGLEAAMRALGARSCMAAAVLPGKKEAGLLCFLSTRPGYEWGASRAGFMRIVSNMVSDTLVKLDSVRKVQYIAYHDQLTGLPNRLLLKDRLNQAMALAKRNARMVGVVFLDLDSFKSVNDTMGHDLGDQLLRQLADSLSHCVRKYDTVARIGGDEFVLLLNQLPSTAALLAVMRKIMDVVRRPVVLRGQEFFMTGSAGVALYPQDGEDAETLISNADIAMYRAKGKGKNSYVLCSQDMKDEIIDQMRMTNLLYRAQEKNQLLVYYQPQVSLATGQISGLEALLRWRLPDQGLVSPGVFIPLAEKTGLIQPIGRWVLETACRQNKLWQERGFTPVRMAVNVSVQQLVSGNFADQVAETLEKTGLPPRWLELEVTESVANSGGPAVSKTFAALKRMGVSLSIDDFGTEYSSLNRLKLLPIDRLKLDIQFVRGIESSEKDRAITKTIISLAKNLNMEVVAEGVETEAELAFLSQRLCDQVQGFYYYKPMPPEELEPHLRRPEET